MLSCLTARPFQYNKRGSVRCTAVEFLVLKPKEKRMVLSSDFLTGGEKWMFIVDTNQNEQAVI